MKKSLFLCSLLALLSCGAENTKIHQEPSETEASITLRETGTFDPIANSKAVAGGTLTTSGGKSPKSLNYWLDANSFCSSVMGLFFENLVNLHSKNNEAVGGLAKSWQVSEDGMSFTFDIDPEAKWSDGKDVVAEDIQFYFDTMMNPKNLTSIFRVDLKRFKRPVVLGPKKIKIEATTQHWNNFWAVANLTAFPKHIWEGKDFNQINFDFPVVSGPYKIKELKKGRYLSLQRRHNWWGRVKKYNQFKYNFNVIKYRFVDDRIKVLEMFKKGDLDALAIYTSSHWAQKTQFDAVKKGWVLRQKVYNKEPIGYQGIAMNLRRPLFQDKRVRLALSHLLDRKSINEKLMFNQYFLLNSYYSDLYPDNKNPTHPILEFSPEKARALLKEAGWKVNDKGILFKDGVPFKFSFLSSSSDHRHLNTYIEDLKSVGITASIEQLSQSSVTKKKDHHDFDMIWQAWGAGRLRDPESSWSSKEADRTSTANICGVKDPQIDAWIEEQKTESSLDKRNDILKKIDSRLANIMPYVLLWLPDFHRILYWNRFGTPEHLFGKYYDPASIAIYWWEDASKLKKLDEAQLGNKNLSPQPGVVRYAE